MKKTLIYMLAMLAIGSGCRKTYNDTIAGQTPDERIAAAMAAYQKKLTSAPYGWIFLESTTGEAFNQGVSQAGPKIILAYYMQFTDSNKVSMISDFDPSMAAAPATSSYRVKSLQRPTLIFDTYSYLHTPCDPDPAISKSPYGYGYGWGTDFEFSFADSVSASTIGDTINLIGNLNGAKGKMIKATQQQRDAYLAGNVQNLMVGVGSSANILEYFKRLTLGSNTYEVQINSANRTVTFTWIDGSGNVKTSTVYFYITGTGIVFSSPIVNGSQTITGIDNVTYNSGNFTLSVTIGGQQGTVAGAAAPIKADAGAPDRWWNYGVNNGYFWASASGFHINGVDDAYGVRNITDSTGKYYYYMYWPGYYSNPGDRFYPVLLYPTVLTFCPYGTVSQPPATLSDGTAVFQVLGDDSKKPVPVGGPADKSNKMLYNTAGYYFVQTGEKSYDMVLATDGRTWISWFWPL
jgi:hypothetical protein